MHRAIEGMRERPAFAARRLRDVRLREVTLVVAGRVRVGKMFAVRREARVCFEAGVPRQLHGLRARDVDHVHVRAVRVVEDRVRREQVGHVRAVRGPRERRLRFARRDALRARREPARRASRGGNDVEIGRALHLARHDRLRREDEAVAEFVRAVAFGLRLLGHVRERAAVGPPCELFDAFGRSGHRTRVAAVERHHPHLRFRIVAVAGVRHERELRAVGRERRIREALAIVRQRASRVRRDIDELEIAGRAILIPDHVRHDERHARPVR